MSLGSYYPLDLESPPSIVSIIIAGTRKGQLDDGHLLELWPCIEIRACAEAI